MFQIAAAELSGSSLRQTVHTHCASVHQQYWICSLRAAGVTAGLGESSGSLPPGLWLTSPAGWLPRTAISSGTLLSVIEYGLTLPFYPQNSDRIVTMWRHFTLCIGNGFGQLDGSGRAAAALSLFRGGASAAMWSPAEDLSRRVPAPQAWTASLVHPLTPGIRPVADHACIHHPFAGTNESCNKLLYKLTVSPL